MRNEDRHFIHIICHHNMNKIWPLVFWKAIGEMWSHCLNFWATGFTDSANKTGLKKTTGPLNWKKKKRYLPCFIPKGVRVCVGHLKRYVYPSLLTPPETVKEVSNHSGTSYVCPCPLYFFSPPAEEPNLCCSCSTV